MPRTSTLLRILIGHFLPLIAFFSFSRPAAAQEAPTLPAPDAVAQSEAPEPTIADVIAVSTGGFHTCALTDGGPVGGAAFCWGRDDMGQLGDGPVLEHQTTPVAVIGLIAGGKALATGTYHSCALTTLGAVLCWGADDHGQLGDGGARQNQPVPVPVVGLPPGVLQIAAGNHHTCALTAAGGVKCWGDDSLGQLGNGDAPSQATPSDVVGLTGGVQAIATGASHTCALLNSGIVQCWGDNLLGKLGASSSNPQEAAPVPVLGLPANATEVAAGFNHTCAISGAGGVYCWGYDDFGQLGNDVITLFHSAPVQVVGMSSSVVELTAGFNHTCAAFDNGIAQCWGDNSYGQIGNNKPNDEEPEPVNVLKLDDGALVMSGGRQHTCALTSTAKLKCWGDDSYGQLGDGGANEEKPVPVDVRAAIPRLNLPIAMRP